jgi:hypothetical protein
VNFIPNHRFEIRDDVVSAFGLNPIEDAAVLGPVKAGRERRGQP